MGYTHYTQRKVGDHNSEIWDKFIGDCKTLYKNLDKIPPQEFSVYNTETRESEEKLLPIMLNGCVHYKYPQFNSNRIWFNGASIPSKYRKKREDGGWEDDPVDAGHETFVIERALSKKLLEEGQKTFMSFCKTARKPYDIMVTACLILYKWYFPKDVSISSDGDIEDWTPAFIFISEVLPQGKGISLEYLIQDKSPLFEDNV